MNKAFLLIGGNLGSRESFLEKATELIRQRLGNLLLESPIYETAAWGIKDQPAFLNQVLLIETALSPIDLLNGLLDIEKEMGRHRVEKFGPRIIDLDILFYEHWILHLPGLQIPHPRIPERRFVLAPICEIAPDFRHPVLNLSMLKLLEQCQDSLVVHKWDYPVHNKD